MIASPMIISGTIRGMIMLTKIENQRQFLLPRNSQFDLENSQILADPLLFGRVYVIVADGTICSGNIHGNKWVT